MPWRPERGLLTLPPTPKDGWIPEELVTTAKKSSCVSTKDREPTASQEMGVRADSHPGLTTYPSLCLPSVLVPQIPGCPSLYYLEMTLALNSPNLSLINAPYQPGSLASLRFCWEHMRRKHVEMPPPKFSIKGWHSSLWIWSPAMRSLQSFVKMKSLPKKGRRKMCFRSPAQLRLQPGGRKKTEADCSVVSLSPAFRSGYKHGISSSAWVEKTLNVIYSDP